MSNLDRHIEFNVQPSTTEDGDRHLPEIARFSLLGNIIKFKGKKNHCAHQHSGKIWNKSIVGAGSIFSFTIPKILK